MGQFEFINLSSARTMGEKRLQNEIGKRSKYLKEQFGMDAEEAANFVASLLNMGVAMNEIFESRKQQKHQE